MELYIVGGLVLVAVWIYSLVHVWNRAINHGAKIAEGLLRLLNIQPEGANVFVINNSPSVRATANSIVETIRSRKWPPQTRAGWNAWLYNLRYIIFPRLRPRDQ